MREMTGDLWTVAATMGPTPRALCITTNGDVNRAGDAVMGRGIAKQATLRYPDIKYRLGVLLLQYGNRPMVLYHELPYSLVTFPVKQHWNRRAVPELIVASAERLVQMADKFGWHSVYLPRPGCGNGLLQWEDVKPLLGMLDDRFAVVEWPGGSRR